MAGQGEGASQPQIELYRVVYEAGRPLTFKEICDGITPHFRYNACEWFRTRATEGLLTESDRLLVTTADKDGKPWADELMQYAWETWVEYLITRSNRSKRLSPTRLDGQAVSPQTLAHVPRDQKVWTVNPDKPPMVSVTTYVEVKKTTPWTPHLARAGARQNQKRRYLNNNEAMLQIVDHSRLTKKDDLRKHLIAGAEALENEPG